MQPHHQQSPSIRAGNSIDAGFPTTEKDTTVVTIVTAETSSQQDTTPTRNYRKNAPVLGFVGLGGVLLAAALSTVVLIFSNGKRKEQWLVAPNIILSGLNSFASIMLAIAVAQGASISWWRRAMNGSTVKDLHRSWGFSSSIKTVVCNLGSFNVIALAALATKLAIVDSLLLQKAFSTTGVGWYETVNTVIGVSPKVFPTTGILEGDQTVQLTEHFKEVVMEWLVGSGDLYFDGEVANFRKCNGICAGPMEMLGFEMTCSDFSESTVEYSMSNSSDPSNRAFYTTWGMTLPGSEQDYSAIDLDYGYTTTVSSEDSETCQAVFRERTCKFRPALVDCTFYFIDVQDFGVADAVTHNGLWLYPDPVFESNYTMNDISYTQSSKQSYMCSVVRTLPQQDGLDVTDGNSTVGGLQFALAGHLSSSFVMDYSNTTGTWTVKQEGMIPLIETVTTPSKAGGCDFTFYDPMDYIAARTNQLTFALSMRAFEDFVDNSDIDIYDNFKVGDKVTFYDSDAIGEMELLNDSFRTYSTIQYQTNFYFLAGGLISMAVVIACVLPSFWGYWEIDATPTLGPFEIATAFRTPGLDAEDNHRRSSDGPAPIPVVIKSMGKKQVVPDGELKGRLVIRETEVRE